MTHDNAMAGAASGGRSRARPADHRPAPSPVGSRRAIAISSTISWPTRGPATTSRPRCSSNAARSTARPAPELMAPVGQVEFANGVAAMAASGSLRRHAGLRRHRRHGGSADRRRGGGSARCPDRGRRRALPRHPLHHQVGRRRGAEHRPLQAAARPHAGPRLSRGLCDACAAQALLRRDGLSPAAPGAGGSRPRLPGHHHRAEPLRRSDRATRAPT